MLASDVVELAHEAGTPVERDEYSQCEPLGSKWESGIHAFVGPATAVVGTAKAADSVQRPLPSNSKLNAIGAMPYDCISIESMETMIPVCELKSIVCPPSIVMYAKPPPFVLMLPVKVMLPSLNTAVPEAVDFPPITPSSVTRDERPASMSSPPVVHVVPSSKSMAACTRIIVFS